MALISMVQKFVVFTQFIKLTIIPLSLSDTFQ